MACRAKNCEGEHFARGLCSRHYRRHQLGKDIDAPSYFDKTPKERLFERVVKTTSCWNWTGSTRPTGWYGCISVNGKNVSTHRLSYEIHIGPIPKGLCVLHKCDNPLCVNPDHLFLGTSKDNVIDSVDKGRNAKGEFCNKLNMTEGDVRIIRDLVSAGCKQCYIVDFFGLKKMTVGEIVRRKTWKHIA